MMVLVVEGRLIGNPNLHVHIPDFWEDPKSGTPNPGLQYSCGVVYGALLFGSAKGYGMIHRSSETLLRHLEKEQQEQRPKPCRTPESKYWSAVKEFKVSCHNVDIQ